MTGREPETGRRGCQLSNPDLQANMRLLGPTPAAAPTLQARQAGLNVLIIVGHPRKGSFCGALARAYRKGASRTGVALRELWLADLRFDRDVRSFSPAVQA